MTKAASTILLIRLQARVDLFTPFEEAFSMARPPNYYPDKSPSPKTVQFVVILGRVLPGSPGSALISNASCGA